MSNSDYYFDQDNLLGDFTLVKVYSKETCQPIAFGIHRGGFNGKLVCSPGCEDMFEDVKNFLSFALPDFTWTLN